MAKRDKNEQDVRFPYWWARKQLRGRVYLQRWRGIEVYRAWPKPRGPAATPAAAEHENNFARLARATQDAWEVDRVAAEAIATGSQYIWRDVLSRAMVGRLITMQFSDEAIADMSDVQSILNQISDEDGSMVMRAGGLWVALNNPLGLPVVTWDVVNQVPEWGEPPPLPDTGVAAGSYTAANITVDAKGIISAASDGSVLPSAAAGQPGFAASRYYTAQHASATTTATGSANTIYAHPFFVGPATTFTKMAILLGAGAGSGQAELGVYANSLGVPGALLFDAGAVTTTSSGKKEITGLTCQLDPGWYWLAVGFNVLHTSVRCFASSTGTQFNILGQLDTLAQTTSYIGCSGAWTFSAGNFPDPFPTPTMQSANQPTVYIGV